MLKRGDSVTASIPTEHALRLSKWLNPREYLQKQALIPAGGILPNIYQRREGRQETYLVGLDNMAFLPASRSACDRLGETISGKKCSLGPRPRCRCKNSLGITIYDFVTDAIVIDRFFCTPAWPVHVCGHRLCHVLARHVRCGSPLR